MPILDDRSLEFLSHSTEQTERLGVRLGELIKGGDVLCLSGDLGSGKTTLARGIARGWGALDPVTSPTFVLINEYRRADSRKILHFDAFRIGSRGEAEALGLYELLDSKSPIMIEWPNRVKDLLPSDYLWIELSWVEEQRRGVYMRAYGLRYERLIRQYRKAAFGGS